MKRLTYLLFILLFSCNLNAYSQELSKDELKDIIETYFIIKKDVPTRFYSNILITIDGNPTRQDSAIIQEIVDTLNSVIATWDVYIIDGGTSNFNIQINNQNPRSELFSSTRLSKDQKEIIESKVVISYDNISPMMRRKKIYYQVLRALVEINHNTQLQKLIPGSVFAEKKAADINFSPVDYQLLSGVYSESFDNISRKTSTKRNLMPVQARRTIKIITNILAPLLSVFFLLWWFLNGIFVSHNYVAGVYFKQGLVVIIACFIFFLIIALSSIFFGTDVVPFSFAQIIPMLVGLFIIFSILGALAIVIIYYCEKYLLQKNESFQFQIFVPFLMTTFVPSGLILLFLLLVTSPLKNGAYLQVFQLSLSLVSYSALIAILRTFLIYISRKSESIIHKKDVELARLNELHKQAELQSLRSKINPHFLYNSLNSIASLATTDALKTEQMALSLSDFFRYSINREQKQTNPIAEELQAVQTYLEIEKVRFGDRLNYEIVCPEDLCSLKIPQLLVQPLVENAIKHGISKTVEHGFVKVLVSSDSKFLKIRVSDNGPNFPDGPLTGFGIRNTHERLNLVYGAKASIYWENDEEKFIEITLPL